MGGHPYDWHEKAVGGSLCHHDILFAFLRSFAADATVSVDFPTISSAFILPSYMDFSNAHAINFGMHDLPIMYSAYLSPRTHSGSFKL